MRTIRRGLRSILRSPLRTGLLVSILAASIGLTAIMITVDDAFARRLDNAKGIAGRAGLILEMNDGKVAAAG